MSRKQYECAGEVFKTQKEFESRIREIRDSYGMDVKHSDPFLVEHLNKHHPHIAGSGQSCVSLMFVSPKKQDAYGLSSHARWRGCSGLMIGFFEPIGQWRNVSLFPWRWNPITEIKAALREKINNKLPLPSQDARCASEGCSAVYTTLEYHHEHPTFDKIAEACISLMSGDEIQTCFGYSKFSGKETITKVSDFIPETHPALVYLYDAHETNHWKWLCPFHHRNEVSK